MRLPVPIRRLANAILRIRPRRFDVVVLGKGYKDWASALAADSPIWPRQAVRSVRRPDAAEDSPGFLAVRRRLVIPLLEQDAQLAPKSGWGLIPSQKAITVLADKARFAAYAAGRGRQRLLPKVYATPDDVVFPAVLKRTDLAAGNGVVIVQDRQSLAQHLARSQFKGHRTLIQQFVAGPEFTAHAILMQGRVQWSCAYRHHTPLDTVRRPRSDEPTDRIELNARDIRDIESLLRPLGYDGPANIDFKRAPNGRMVILEINPRFGGSLFRPQNTADLTAAIAALIGHARWRGLGPAARRFAAGGSPVAAPQG